MSDFMSSYFGPLNKDACVYFLFLSMLFFAVLIFTLVTEVIFIIKNFKNLSFKNISSGILVLFNVFIAYFVNRLLYTMCSKTLA